MIRRLLHNRANLNQGPDGVSTLLLLNGPNLDRLGRREPATYGHDTLPEIEGRLRTMAEAAGHQLETFQSHDEAALISRIHAAADAATDFILFNPAAFTHTSVALRDALLAAAIPFIEIHLSNVHAREAFRQHSYFSDIAQGVICGLGAVGYELALQAALRQLSNGTH